MHTSQVYGIFPHSSVSKESAYKAGDPGSIPGLGRSPEEGNGNPLQCSCLENAMDRGAWLATAPGVARVRHHLAATPLPPGWGNKHQKMLMIPNSMYALHTIRQFFHLKKLS